MIVSVGFPPVSGAVGTIMKQLADALDPSRVVVATAKWRGQHARLAQACELSYPVLSPAFRFGSRIDRYWQRLDWRLAASRLAVAARRHRCGGILVAFPDLSIVRATMHAARACDIPCCVHIHDTIEESLAGGPFEQAARKAESEIFRRPWQALPLTGGLSDLYSRKYDMKFVDLPHPYSEAVAPPRWSGTSADRSACWSGTAYSINDRAFSRLHAAARAAGIDFVITSPMPGSAFSRLIGHEFDLQFLPSRQQYLDFLRVQGVHVVGVNWPDETDVHTRELETIFPTKVPEYLASGVPVLVHCPDHYYLARFIKDQKCGVVVSSREPEALRVAMLSLFENPEWRLQLVRRAQEVVSQRFNVRTVVQTLADHLEGIWAGTSPPWRR
jgi:hypothetical protein